jgi:DNA replicative helicase MCM subunit Mcm2 (Cdc46/Mcm family)
MRRPRSWLLPIPYDGDTIAKSLSENINLPNSLLSRFDLLYLILDIADVDRDMALARYLCPSE